MLPRQASLAVLLLALACSSENTSRPLSENAPEGLSLVGSWKPGAPTAVYVHGWAIDGKPAAFLNAGGWHEEGFNTLIFRWTKDATDNGECRLWGAVPFACPAAAQARIWNSREAAGARFVSEWKRFFGNMDAPGEVRLIGHSLGTQMATYLAWTLHAERWQGPQPARIDLLDPYVTSAALTGGGVLPEDSAFSVPPVREKTASCNEGNTRLAYCVIENAMRSLRDERGTAVTVYGTSFAPTYARDLLRHFNSVLLNKEWTCPPAGAGAACAGERERGREGAQHVLILPAYFWSIREAVRGDGVFTARTPTVNLHGKVHFVKGNSGACPAQDERQMLAVMAGAFHPEVGSRDELTGFLRRLGFSAEAAERCSGEVSFAGHSAGSWSRE